jgi:hypothetical protein
MFFYNSFRIGKSNKRLVVFLGIIFNHATDLPKARILIANCNGALCFEDYFWMEILAGGCFGRHADSHASTQGESIRSNERLVCAGRRSGMRRLRGGSDLDLRSKGDGDRWVPVWRGFACATAASPSAPVWLKRLGDQIEDKDARSRLLPWR